MNEDEYKYAIRPNKEELKRRLKASHLLGQELVKLPEAHFSSIPLSKRAKAQVLAAKGFKKSALQRQLRFISSLLQEEDEVAIREALRLVRLPHKKEVEAFHQFESWRDQLISGHTNAFTQLVDTYPNIDRQHIQQLIRNAQKEALHNKPPKASRMLFKYLQSLQIS